MAVELTIAHRRLWWQPEDEDDEPDQWASSADVSPMVPCPEEHRHVGDIELSLSDLTPERSLLDAIEMGDWAMEFIAETVLDIDDGALVPELDEQIGDGPERMVILEWVELEPAWRGHGLAAPLTAGTLERFAQLARLAVCRLSPADFIDQCPDRVTAELASIRLGGMLEKIGFFLWKGVYVVDLRNPALIDASLEPMERWGPYSGLSF